MAFVHASTQFGVVRHYLPRPMYRHRVLSLWNESYSLVRWDSSSSRPTCTKGISELITMANGSHADQQGAAYDHACAQAIALLSSPNLEVRDLVQAHRLLAPEASAGIRQGTAWLGGSSPVDARMVFPPAAQVALLLRQSLLLLTDSRYCPALRAAAIYVRLLDIHAFADGNGRLARATFAAMAYSAGAKLEWIESVFASIARSGSHEWLHLNWERHRTDEWGPVLAQFLNYMNSATQQIRAEECIA